MWIDLMGHAVQNNILGTLLWHTYREREEGDLGGWTECGRLSSLQSLTHLHLSLPITPLRSCHVTLYLNKKYHIHHIHIDCKIGFSTCVCMKQTQGTICILFTSQDFACQNFILRLRDNEFMKIINFADRWRYRLSCNESYMIIEHVNFAPLIIT